MSHLPGKIGLRGLVWAAVFCFGAVAMARAQDGFVRVNQVGYESGRRGRAYLMTRAPETNANFSVEDSAGVVLATAPIEASTGTWGDFTVYPLYFFQNERDGADFISTPLREAPGHLHDQNAAVYLTPEIDQDDNLVGDLTPTGATINASGGWWDAGDYLKFVETESYTTALMLIGVRDFPTEMDGSSLGANFTAEAKFGVGWLQRMWNDDSRTLYYQGTTRS